MPIHKLENREFQLELRDDEKRLMLSLVCRKNGYSRENIPLLELEIRDRMQERVELQCRYQVLRLDCEDTGIHATVRDSFRGIVVGIWLNLTDDGELSVIMPPAEIEESKPELYRLCSVNVLPGLLSVGNNGKLLLPVNSGFLCSPAGKGKASDRFLMYGEQERWELLPTTPICGASAANGGLLAVATQGACDMYCSVSLDGQGSGSVGFHPMFRRDWIDPVDWAEREIRIVPVPSGEDLTQRAALRLRRHLIEDLGMPGLAARAAESPQCAYQQRAYTMKLLHGIQRQGIMMYGKESGPDDLFYLRTMTFAAAENGMRRLKAAGIDRVFFQSVGWNPKGHDGAWPTDFPIDRRLGGETGFRKMIDCAKSLGYHITTHLDFGMACFKSPDFDPDLVIHDLWGEPKVTGDWGGGIHGTHWGMALPEKLVEGRLLALKRLGFNGMQYLDFQGNPLYVNHNPRHRGPRSQFAAGIRRYQDAARKIFGAVQIEAGYMYCAPYADAVNAPYYTPFKSMNIGHPEWPISGLLDEPVPLWQLAMHGLVTQEENGVNWQNAMNAVLFGRVLREEWSAEPGCLPVLDDNRIARQKALYDLVTVRFGHLVTEQIAKWERLAPGVERTVFSDGTEVTADFNAKRLVVNGKEINQPKILADDIS